MNKLGHTQLYGVLLMFSVSLIPAFNAGFDNWWVYGFTIVFSIAAVYLAVTKKASGFVHLGSPFTWFILFTLWGGLSLIWSVSPVRTEIEFIQLSLYALVFYFAAGMDEAWKIKLGRIAILAGTVLALIGICEYVFLDAVRIQSTFPNPNPFSIYAVMLSLVALGYAVRKNAGILWISPIILLTAIFLSGSRGATLAGILGLILIFFGLKKENLWKAALKTAGCILISLILTLGIVKIAPLIQGTAAPGSMNSLMRVDGFSTSIQGRLEFWRVAKDLALTKPVNGYGLGSYSAAYATQYGGNRWYSRYAHNYYLQVMSELGIVGFVFLSVFLIFCVYLLVRKLRSEHTPEWMPGILGAVVAFMVHIGMDFSWNFPGVTVIFMALLGVSVGREEVRSKMRVRICYGLKAAAFILAGLLAVWQISSEYFGKTGIELAAKKEYMKSNQCFYTAERINPSNYTFYYLHAMNYIRLNTEDPSGQYGEDAGVLLDKAIDLAPYRWEYYDTYGQLLLDCGDPGRAKSYFEKAMQYSAYRIEPYLYLGLIYRKEGNTEEAKELWNKGLSYADYDLNAAENESTDTYIKVAFMHYWLANIYESEGDHAEAERHVDAVNALIQERPEIGNVLAGLSESNQK